MSAPMVVEKKAEEEEEAEEEAEAEEAETETADLMAMGVMTTQIMDFQTAAMVDSEMMIHLILIQKILLMGVNGIRKKAAKASAVGNGNGQLVLTQIRKLAFTSTKVAHGFWLVIIAV